MNNTNKQELVNQIMNHQNFPWGLMLTEYSKEAIEDIVNSLPVEEMEYLLEHSLEPMTQFYEDFYGEQGVTKSTKDLLGFDVVLLRYINGQSIEDIETYLKSLLESEDYEQAEIFRTALMYIDDLSSMEIIEHLEESDRLLATGREFYYEAIDKICLEYKDKTYDFKY